MLRRLVGFLLCWLGSAGSVGVVLACWVGRVLGSAGLGVGFRGPVGVGWRRARGWVCRIGWVRGSGGR